MWVQGKENRIHGCFSFFFHCGGDAHVWKMDGRSHCGDKQEAPSCAAQDWALTEGPSTWDGALGIGMTPC